MFNENKIAINNVNEGKKFVLLTNYCHAGVFFEKGHQFLCKGLSNPDLFLDKASNDLYIMEDHQGTVIESCRLTTLDNKPRFKLVS